MEQHKEQRLNPFLGDAAVSFVPELTDDQLVRLAGALAVPFAHILVSRLTDFTALIQGIPVEAGTEHEAKGVAWDVINREVRAALSTPADEGTQLTSIDVRLPAKSEFDLG